MMARMTRRLAAGLVLSVMTAACASSGAVPRPFPTPGQSKNAPSSDGPTAPGLAGPGQTTPTSDAALIETALSLRGVPYRNGGSDLRGFDCSGFTQYVFAQHGIALPREVREQFEIGEKIKLEDVKIGDLVFFRTVAKNASHVGIVVDDDEFVHAPSSTGVVRVEHLSTAYWSKRFIAARRVGQAQLGARPLPFPLS
jgi:cell wall-associated NlpC family hydrolase